jgi:hypothetical protein
VIEAELDVDEVIKAIVKGLCEPYGKAVPIRFRLQKIRAQKR